MLVLDRMLLFEGTFHVSRMQSKSVSLTRKSTFQAFQASTRRLPIQIRKVACADSKLHSEGTAQLLHPAWDRLANQLFHHHILREKLTSISSDRSSLSALQLCLLRQVVHGPKLDRSYSSSFAHHGDSRLRSSLDRRTWRGSPSLARRSGSR